MAEARSNTQLPLGGTTKSVMEEELEAFQQGIEIGRKYADVARRRVAAWAEEHPGQLALAGLAAGFFLGKLVFHRRHRINLADLNLDE
jgi:hypothetical protein